MLNHNIGNNIITLIIYLEAAKKKEYKEGNSLRDNLIKSLSLCFCMLPTSKLYNFIILHHKYQFLYSPDKRLFLLAIIIK